MEAHNWPILTDDGVVRSNISFAKSGSGGIFRMTVRDNGRLAHLRVRMPTSSGYVWREQNNVSTAYFKTR
jgi:hypothetical protein